MRGRMCQRDSPPSGQFVIRADIALFGQLKCLITVLSIALTAGCSDTHSLSSSAPTLDCETSLDRIELVQCSQLRRQQKNAVEATINSPADWQLYLQQAAPGLAPEVFAPGLISLPDRGEFASVFSADGTEFFFGRGNGTTVEILSTRLVDGVWTDPSPVVTHERYSYMDAALSPDESRLYYISNQPLDGESETKDPDIWLSRRSAGGWGAPEHAGTPLNSEDGEYYVSFTETGTLYFTSNREAPAGQEIDFDIHAAAYRNGVFEKPVRLGNAINSKGYDGDVFVAPDESYLIFSSDRPDGYGSGDLYVSFQTEDGGWSEARNMGATINTEHQDYCPFVTRDGRYLFFSSNGDIYWMDAAVIETYR